MDADERLCRAHGFDQRPDIRALFDVDAILKDMGPGQTAIFRRPHAGKSCEIDHRAITRPALLHEVILFTHDVGSTVNIAHLLIGGDIDFGIFIFIAPACLDANPGGWIVTGFAHDGVGRHTQLTTPSGQSIDLGYDPAGRITGMTFPNTVTSTVSYDPLTGRLAQLTVAYFETGRPNQKSLG